MTPHDPDLRRVTDWLREEAESAPSPTYLDAVLTTTSRTQQVTTWRRAWRSSIMWIESVLRRQPAIVWAGLVVVLLVGSLAIVTAWPRPTVHNGMLALAADDGLYLADAVGTAPREVMEPLELSPSPWSPDGSRLLATSGSGALVVVDGASTDVVGLTNEAFTVHGADWSPDGSRIVFSATTPTVAGGPHLYTIEADGSDLQPLTVMDAPDGQRSHVRGDDPVWSPDGRWIAFVYQETQLWVVRSDGGDQRLLSDAGAAAMGTVTSVSWSPDSSSVAYLRGGSAAGGAAPAAVHVRSLADDDDRAISVGDDPSDSPVWSPDGTRIAWLDVRPEGSRIVLFDVATGHTSEIATATSLQSGWLAWSPDGAWLASGTADAQGLALIDVDRSEPDRSVSIGSRVRGAAWQPIIES